MSPRVVVEGVEGVEGLCGAHGQGLHVRALRPEELGDLAARLGRLNYVNSVHRVSLPPTLGVVWYVVAGGHVGPPFGVGRAVGRQPGMGGGGQAASRAGAGASSTRCGGKASGAGGGLV